MRDCKVCGKAIYWVDGLGAWYHWNLADMLTCPSVRITPREDPFIPFETHPESFYETFADEELTADILLELSDDLGWLADRFPQLTAQALALRAQVRRELGKDDPPEEGNEE